VTQEGVIRFNLDFTQAPPPPDEDVAGLIHWHSKLHDLGLIGQDPDRYDGYAYGNLSCRHATGGFLISATQTGGKDMLLAGDFCHVTAWNIEENSVTAHGPRPPSSESLTHGMIYRLDPGIHVVFHVHAPGIWRNAGKLGIPLTARHIPYGTPDMAREIGRLFEDTQVAARGVIAMGGHEDGIISFAATHERAGQLLLELAQSAERR
jgi:hypothetical protein